MILLASWAGPAIGEDVNSTVPLSRLFSKYADFLAMPADKRVDLVPRYKLLSKLANPSDVVLAFVFKGKQQHIAVDADGFLDFSPSKAMLEANPIVSVNQLKGTMGISLSIGFKIGEAKKFDMAVLHGRVHRAFKAAKSLGGIMAVFAPSHTGLRLKFNSSCSAPSAFFSAEGKDEPLLFDKDGFVLVPFKKQKKMRKGGDLKLSCPVSQAELA